MLIAFVIIIVLVIVLRKIFELKIHIDWKTFFRRGFQKIDNKFGLFCYCGKQGKGKTYSAVKFLIEQKLAHNYRILTNVKSFKVFNDTLYFDDITKMIDYCINKKPEDEKVIIFFDEIFTILEKNTAINKDILSFISQLRKRKIIFITTAQEWAEINKTFRRYCRYQIECNMFGIPLFYTAFIYNIINDGDKLKWDNDTQDFVAPRVASNFAKCNRSIIESYDTFETINVK